jgi:hypothetical protein
MISHCNRELSLFLCRVLECFSDKHTWSRMGGMCVKGGGGRLVCVCAP